jgi:aminopeptidase
MADPRIAKLADLLVNYSVSVRSGDKVLINGNSMAAPLLREVYTSVLRAGGHPLMLVSLPDMDDVMYRLASEEQLMFLPPPLMLGVETYDASISISGAENTKNLSNVDPAKVVARSQGRRPMLDTFMNRSASGALRWTGTLFPTHAYAQDAEMSLHDYEDFVYRACMPDPDDPIGYWRRFSLWQQKIVEWLRGKKEIRVCSRDTDLNLCIDQRAFISCDGHHNMPDGEVFTGPVENTVEGHVTFSYPAIYQGREVTGVRLAFEKGKVVNATAEKNEAFLQKILDTDEGARYVGEFAIGTNEGIQQFTREILFDEKIGGTFHMALGAGYPETGSRNKSSIHWDMICDLRDGGEIWVDNVLLYREGRFVIEF